ncbi:LytTR family transcriptional regulator DNA-binding domain-containing protein [Mucilaginibacter defluvii]|uniref:LytTR family transcriptional regulator DNA-binding domain-containing protein n=1 Tax=Mucilaginibacter defluvii TaxID=1196019 RepID=UPI003CD088E1
MWSKDKGGFSKHQQRRHPDYQYAIAALEAMLPGTSIIRVHRSFIIATNKIVRTRMKKSMSQAA